MRKYFIIITAIVLFATGGVYAQNVTYISSDLIREKCPEVLQAEARLHAVVEDWTREIASYQKRIDDLDLEIRNNRYVWSADEIIQKNKELSALKSNRESYAKQKFEPGGEYDLTVSQIMKPLEGKIYAAAQEDAATKDYDTIIGQIVYYYFIINLVY